jgi:hypothetical protein
MIHKYAEWCRKRAGTAQCSPALGVLGLLVAVAITCYIYRQVILSTVRAFVAAVVIVAAVAAVIAITVSTVRFLRAQRIAAIERMPAPVPDTWTKYEEPATVTDEDVKAISEEADWLATGVELAFSPDGKTLKAKS